MSGITNRIPPRSPPLQKRFESPTAIPKMPGTIDDQLERAKMTSCPKNKRKALQVLKGLCGDPEYSDEH